MQLSTPFPETPYRCTQRVILIDTGCQGLYGHHVPANALIMEQCLKTNTKIKILVNSTCPEGIADQLNADPILSPSTYLPLPKERVAALSMVQTSNEDTFRQLLFQGPRLESGDQVILHTASFWHLLGIYKWWKLFHDVDVRFSIVFRFPPLGSFDTTGLNDSTKSALLEFCAEVMSLWNQHQAVAFFSDSHELMGTYRGQLGADIQPICMPLHSGYAAETHHKNSGPAPATRFIFPGAARKEKGIELLADLIPRYLETKPETEFVIQSLQGAPGEAAEKLDAFSTSLYPRNVQIVGKPLFGKDYFDFLTSASAVLLPYNQVHYGSKTSQIFYESLIAARPVIVTRNTSMAEQLPKFSPESILQAEGTVDGFINALLEFESRKSALTKNAERVARQIKKTHNQTRFIDSLFPPPFEFSDTVREQVAG